jgi:hypothetical protein
MIAIRIVTDQKMMITCKRIVGMTLIVRMRLGKRLRAKMRVRMKRKWLAPRKVKRPKRPNMDAVTLKPFGPLFPPLDLNRLLNCQSVASGAQGKFHRIYESRLALIVSAEFIALSL